MCNSGWSNAALLYLQRCPHCKGRRIYTTIDGRSYPTSGHAHKARCPRMPALDPRNLKRYGIVLTP